MIRRLRVPDAFELLIAWLCLASGASLALGAPPPNSVQRVLPSWLIHTWGLTLCVGGLLIVTGVMIRHRSRTKLERLVLGLRIERAGLVPLAAASAVFGLVICVVGGWRGAFAAGTYLAFAAACLCRTSEAAETERGLAKAMSVGRLDLGQDGGPDA